MRIPSWALFLCCLGSPARALEAWSPTDSAGLVLVSPGEPSRVFPMEEPLRSALAARRHTEAARLLGAIRVSSLAGDQVGDHAFLLAWSLIRAEKEEEGVVLMDVVRQARHVPAAYLHLTVAELLLSDDRPLEAMAELAQVPEDSLIHPRAQLVHARASRASGATAQTEAIYEALIAREDPAEGSALALWALALKRGTRSPEAYPLLRRLWYAYPRTDQGREAEAILRQHGPFPTWQEVGMRGRRLMEAGRYRDATNLMHAKLGEADHSAEGCRYRFFYGRSLFKQNRVTDAAAVLGPLGEQCVSGDRDSGAKALYLAGKSEERKKRWSRAAAHYRALSRLYPEHSYADDGLVLAGIALLESGRLQQARDAWTEQVTRYPEGDMAGEGFWRLAWAAWLSGDTALALSWVDRMRNDLPLANDPVHYRAALYWSARWRAYPNRENPRERGEDRAVDEALEIWTALCRDHPLSYYAVQAAARLQDLSPDKLAPLARPTMPQATAPWRIRREFAEDPRVERGALLSRLGLAQEALAEFNQLSQGTLSPAEAAWLAGLRFFSGNWLAAHQRLRHYLEARPPEHLGDQSLEFLRVAYPPRWWAEVQQAASPYAFDARIFHALVREESNFNPRIVSYAGARGLSQLMPATARQVAGWLGVSITMDDLFVPEKNLPIGVRYFWFLLERYEGNPALAMAGYNAGEGNVGRWLDEGNRPTDEFVEAIPFRQTRDYVKRVSTSWQTYHWLYDGGPVFPDVSAYLFEAVPE